MYSTVGLDGTRCTRVALSTRKYDDSFAVWLSSGRWMPRLSTTMSRGPSCTSGAGRRPVALAVLDAADWRRASPSCPAVWKSSSLR